MAERKERTRDEILTLIEDHQPHQTLLDRYDADYSLYRRDPFEEIDDQGKNTGADYQHYTSPAAGVYADKLIGFIAKAVPIIKIPHIIKNPTPNAQQNNTRDDRESDDAAERFFIGILKSVDERLTLTGLSPLVEQWGWYAAVRGGPVMGRALLTKQTDGEDDEGDPKTRTFPDIMPWDPMHVSFERGYNGLLWAAYTVWMTRAEIKSRWDVTIPIEDGGDDEELIQTHDFYDECDNYALTEETFDGVERFLKNQTPHGSPRVPVVYASTGSAPPLQGRNNTISGIHSDHNESVFKHVRGINDDNNLMMSILLEHAVRSREQPLKVFSADGTKTLDDNPHASGIDIPLRQGSEDIQVLEPLKAADETGSLLGLISGDFQRASIPYSAFGQLDFQLSGFAITQLRRDLETPLDSPLNATINAVNQALRLIKDQYLSDQFDTMQLSGLDNNRQYFSEEITPDIVREAGDLQFSLLPVLPQDDPAKLQMAALADKGPTPLLPRRRIYEDILELQDADQIDDELKEQQGERGLPAAALLEMAQNFLRQGRQDMAQLYFVKFQQAVVADQIAFQQALAGTQGAPGASQPQGPGRTNGAAPGPGFSPTTLPTAAQGLPPPTPTPQAGPNVPPGSPRPGALTAQERLRRIGLFGPRG